MVENNITLYQTIYIYNLNHRDLLKRQILHNKMNINLAYKIENKESEKSGQKTFRLHSNSTFRAKNKMISNYQLKQTIGKGSFGKVKKARHIPTGQNAAVKIIAKNKLSSEELENIYSQVAIQKKIKHQNIIKLYQIIETQDSLYIFMEYCSNGDFHQYINKNGPLNEKQACRAFKQILSALQYLHDQKICHRDIKCENVILDQNLNCKLIDFGFAKSYSQNQNLKTSCGSLLYSSPQVAMGLAYNPQVADIWSLGIFLYTITTGQLPFESTDIIHTKYNIISCKYNNKKTFSQPLSNLIAAILTPAANRATIQQIKKSQFYTHSEAYSANYINLQKQQQIYDEQVLQLLCKRYNITETYIKLSLIQNKLDQNCSLYYLTLQSLSFEGLTSNFDIRSSNFKKEKKKLAKSAVKFQSHSRNETMSFIKKSKQSRKNIMENSNQLFRGNKSNIKQMLQLIRPYSPDSPKKKNSFLSSQRKNKLSFYQQ